MCLVHTEQDKTSACRNENPVETCTLKQLLHMHTLCCLVLLQEQEQEGRPSSAPQPLRQAGRRQQPSNLGKRKEPGA